MDIHLMTYETTKADCFKKCNGSEVSLRKMMYIKEILAGGLLGVRTKWKQVLVVKIIVIYIWRKSQ